MQNKCDFKIFRFVEGAANAACNSTVSGILIHMFPTKYIDETLTFSFKNKSRLCSKACSGENTKKRKEIKQEIEGIINATKDE